MTQQVTVIRVDRDWALTPDGGERVSWDNRKEAESRLSTSTLGADALHGPFNATLQLRALDFLSEKLLEGSKTGKEGESIYLSGRLWPDEGGQKSGLRRICISTKGGEGALKAES